MAANTHIDNCPICLSAYHHPKLLDCQHSFCLVCLEDYIIKTSSNGHFPCPLCRHDITVPEGGVPEFPAMSEINRSSTECHACKKDVSKFRCQDCQQNLCQSCTTTHDTNCKDHLVRKIDEAHEGVDNSKSDNSQAQDRKTAPNVIDACPDHRDKAVDVYCKQCLVAMCSMCFITDHNGHEFSNLQDDEIKRSIREQLKTLNAELETHILQLEQFSVNLTTKHTELTNSLEAACDKVDQHVARICTEVKTLGDAIKKDMKENYDGVNAQSGGEANIKQLMEEIETLTQDIKAVVKETVGVLEDNYIVPVLERMPTIRKEIKDYGTRKMEVPDIPNISFKESIIDLGILRQQLGTTVNTNKTIFEHKFDVNSVCNGPMGY